MLRVTDTGRWKSVNGWCGEPLVVSSAALMNGGRFYLQTTSIFRDTKISC